MTYLVWALGLSFYAAGFYGAMSGLRLSPSFNAGVSDNDGGDVRSAVMLICAAIWPWFFLVAIVENTLRN